MSFEAGLPGGSSRAVRELLSLQQCAGESGLSQSLVELLRLYISLRNQCLRSAEMHVQRALDLGETSDRLSGLPAWRKGRTYSRKERAALSWADCVLRRVPIVLRDEYRAVREFFEETELADLTVLIVVSNAWNQVMVSLDDGRASLGQKGW